MGTGLELPPILSPLGRLRMEPLGESGSSSASLLFRIGISQMINPFGKF